MPHPAFAILGIIVTLTLAGCEGSPARLALLPDDELPGQATLNLCEAWHFSGNDRYLAAVERQQAFSAREFAAISAKRLYIGMRTKALLCAWGIPLRTNRLVSEHVVVTRYVYRSGSRTDYIYTFQGKITEFRTSE